jgi:hypothetical protein
VAGLELFTAAGIFSARGYPVHGWNTPLKRVIGGELTLKEARQIVELENVALGSISSSTHHSKTVH